MGQLWCEIHSRSRLIGQAQQNEHVFFLISYLKRKFGDEVNSVYEETWKIWIFSSTLFCNIWSRGRRERYPGTHGYQGTGRNPSKFWKFGYRWVPGTGKIWELGYRWVPGTEQILEVGYRWVPVTEQILEDKSFIFKFECLYNNFNLVKLFGATILGNLYISGIASNAEFLSPLQIPASTGLRFEENSEDFLAGGPVLLEMEKNFKENSKPEFVTSFDINTVVTSRASSKKARLKVAWNLKWLFGSNFCELEHKKLEIRILIYEIITYESH